MRTIQHEERTMATAKEDSLAHRDALSVASLLAEVNDTQVSSSAR